MVEKSDEMNEQGSLKDRIVPVGTEDTMAEAGRKILLADYVKMIESEAGSRTGEDIEAVHDMRVATRRMRSAFNLLEDYYKARPIRPFMEMLKSLAGYLGAVRDLDVMIEGLARYQATLDEENQAVLQPVIDLMGKKRSKSRKKLVGLLDSSDYKTFLTYFAEFLMQPGKAVRAINTEETVPYQVRHLLPSLVHERLASVRAYDNVIEDADERTLHSLRIEFKRLRYVVSYFADVLGTSGADYIEALKAIQDHLGELNDMVIAQAYLQTLVDENDFTHETAQVLYEYTSALSEKQSDLQGLFSDVWTRFNTRTVQRKLSDALLVLR
ncbi:MAG: CHAD domain-containing protein [Chitinophagaceae bacterium]|nr:CHAD domain-containing protein [Anaerolineae bacterium]